MSDNRNYIVVHWHTTVTTEVIHINPHTSLDAEAAFELGLYDTVEILSEETQDSGVADVFEATTKEFTSIHWVPKGN